METLQLSLFSEPGVETFINQEEKDLDIQTDKQAYSNIQQVASDMQLVDQIVKLLDEEKLASDAKKEQARQMDIRTDKQLNKQVAYDVGEKIGGARKDLAAHRKAFMEKPSYEILHEVETTDKQLAAEIVKRDTFFSWFSLEDCRSRDVEPAVAKALQLFIQRIPKEAGDSKEERQAYMKGLLLLSGMLKVIQTKKDYYNFEVRFIAMMYARTYSSTKPTEGRKLEEAIGSSHLEELYQSCGFNRFQGSFLNYFRKNASRKGMLLKAWSIKTWDELLPSKAETTIVKKERKAPLWERALPLKPIRKAGTSLSLTTPSGFIETFGFRGCQFGHYVEDESGLAHLSSAADAYKDLAEILSIPMKKLSLEGTLSMAFGARGSGRALGHYEPNQQIINLTKSNGSLGVLAHEWAHALDHYLFNCSNDFKNGKVGFVSEGNCGPGLSKVAELMRKLVQEMREGTSTSYVDVSNVTDTYRIQSAFREQYKAVFGDLKRFMDIKLDKFDKQANNQLMSYEGTVYYTGLKTRLDRKRKTVIRNSAEALAYHHKEVTGEAVDKIPYTISHSHFYEMSLQMDKRQAGKYWSSNREMFARAFEQYIESELKNLAWQNDYLVCGTYGCVYPSGEEKERIYAAMRNLLAEVMQVLTD